LRQLKQLYQSLKESTYRSEEDYRQSHLISLRDRQEDQVKQLLQQCEELNFKLQNLVYLPTAINRPVFETVPISTPEIQSDRAASNNPIDQSQQNHAAASSTDNTKATDSSMDCDKQSSCSRKDDKQIDAKEGNSNSMSSSVRRIKDCPTCAFAFPKSMSDNQRQHHIEAHKSKRGSEDRLRGVVQK
jgi:hypothetical protein